MLCPIGQSNEKPPLQALAKWREYVTILTDDDYDFEYDLGGNPYSAFNWQIGSQWYYADKDKKKGLTEEDIKQIPDSLKPTINAHVR